MNKKGAELSMNLIIIAAIALLVLVIVSVLVLRAGGNVAKGTGCQGVGGSCQSDSCTDGYVRDITKNCQDKEQICCIPVGATDE